MNKARRSKNDPAQPPAKGLHPRNLHKQGYDFPSLLKSYPPLANHVKENSYGNLSIEFAAPLAVKALNTALLKSYYGVHGWDIPEGALCPPIPGRVDYIHHIAELLGCDVPAIHQTELKPSTQAPFSMLDIGTGANGVYPLLACKIYGWHCVGSDINAQSLDNVASIIASNPDLKDSFRLRLQLDKNCIFDGVIHAGEYFDITVCNPPFHASEEDARKSNQRKLSNLARNKIKHADADLNQGGTEPKTASMPSSLNFGGLEAELWCKGGERLFLKKLIQESRVFSDQCRWFTSLVSKADNLKPAKKLLQKLGATDIREIDMEQGNKLTRILAWTYV